MFPNPSDHYGPFHQIFPVTFKGSLVRRIKIWSNRPQKTLQISMTLVKVLFTFAKAKSQIIRFCEFPHNYSQLRTSEEIFTFSFAIALCESTQTWEVMLLIKHIIVMFSNETYFSYATVKEYPLHPICLLFVFQF